MRQGENEGNVCLDGEDRQLPFLALARMTDNSNHISTLEISEHRDSSKQLMLMLFLIPVSFHEVAIGMRLGIGHDLCRSQLAHYVQ